VPITKLNEYHIFIICCITVFTLFRIELRTALLFGIIIIFSVVWSANGAATVYGQIFQPSPPQAIPLPLTPSSSPSNTTVAGNTTASTTAFVAHGVRITSPLDGLHVPIGTLTVTGTSKDNPTLDCHVSNIVNGVKPYQPASAAGPGGASDYSKWSFILTSKYTLIKEGVNKITAKFSCRPNPALASFYSINVTGTTAGGSSPTIPQPSANTTGR
jgi:hypothetical protein